MFREASLDPRCRRPAAYPGHRPAPLTPSQAAAPLPSAWRAAATPANEALEATADSGASPGDTGIPGARAAQPSGAPLDVIFIDPTHGWSHDATQRTTDGGLTWTAAHAPGTSIASFVSPTEGWAGGSRFFDSDELCHEYIDHTTDGGGTWSRQYTSRGIANPCKVNRLYFVDYLYGWASEYSIGETSIKTTDGGGTWLPTNIEYGYWLKMLDRSAWFRLTASSASDSCYTFRPTGKLSKTTDAGTNWTKLGDFPLWARGGPYIAPDGRFMVVVGEAGHIARSTDGGATWVDVPSPFADDLSWVAFANSAVGWAAGAGGAVFRTGDGGLTWTRQQINTTHDITYLAAFSPNDALLSADRLYRTSDGGGHWLPLPAASEASASAKASNATDRKTADGARKPAPLPAMSLAVTPLLATGREPSAAPGAAQIWYVALGGNDNNTCTSPSAPCASINAAMIKSADGDTLLAAAGRYYGTGNEVAVVYRDVALEGGWNAGFTYQEGFSVLDGQHARRGLTVKSTANAWVRRFIIENGRSDDAGGLRNYGSLVLQNCAVRDNAADSGGILNRMGTLTLWNSAVTDNRGGSAGGISNQATLYIDNSTLSGNRAANDGAAIFSCAGNVAISSSTITNNFVDTWGAITIRSPGSGSLRNSILSGNSDTCRGESPLGRVQPHGRHQTIPLHVCRATDRSYRGRRAIGRSDRTWGRTGLSPSARGQPGHQRGGSCRLHGQRRPPACRPTGGVARRPL